MMSLMATSLPSSVPTNSSSCSTVSTAVFLRKWEIEIEIHLSNAKKHNINKIIHQSKGFYKYRITCVRCWQKPGCQGSDGTTVLRPMCRWRWRKPCAPLTRSRPEKLWRAAPWSPTYRPQTAYQTHRQPATPHWTPTKDNNQFPFFSRLCFGPFVPLLDSWQWLTGSRDEKQEVWHATKGCCSYVILILTMRTHALHYH